MTDDIPRVSNSPFHLSPSPVLNGHTDCARQTAVHPQSVKVSALRSDITAEILAGFARCLFDLCSPDLKRQMDALWYLRAPYTPGSKYVTVHGTGSTANPDGA